ncbi:MAG TPA: hypothetical protein VFL83_12880 [Anaeromyxobacter sp.]|nr:hypothetical protein [Anaeromyxobacter sp.]
MRLVHAGIDRLAMWMEDRVRHAAQPFLPCAPEPLDCLGPLSAIPEPPAAEGPWSTPSPRPVSPFDRMTLLVVPRRAPFRGTAVVVPPWKTDAPSIVRRYTDLLAETGHEVWLLVPPEHMGRASPGARSGHGFATLDLRRFRALFEQLVLEIRTAVAMAARRGRAGVVGLSIGALAASFALASGDAAGFGALVAPPADLAAVLRTTRIGRRYGRIAEEAGTRFPDGPELRRVLAPFDPLQVRPPRSPVFLAVGRYDRIALPDAALALGRAWDVQPRVYARGHLSLLFLCQAMLDDLRRFLLGPAGSAVP